MGRDKLGDWDWHIHTTIYKILEENMATHSSILAGESPWTEEPGGLQFIELSKNQTRLRG